MKKRGQGKTIWIIGSMVLVLIVVLILVFVVSGRITIFQDEIKSCSLNGGECKESCLVSEHLVKNSDCSGEKPKCCVGVFGT